MSGLEELAYELRTERTKLGRTRMEEGLGRLFLTGISPPQGQDKTVWRNSGIPGVFT